MLNAAVYEQNLYIYLFFCTGDGQMEGVDKNICELSECNFESNAIARDGPNTNSDS